MTLPFSPPSLGEEEAEAVAEVLRSGWIASGPLTGAFEERFAAFVGAPAALATSSATAALHLALLTSGAGDGRAVVASTMTFPGAVSVIEQAGGRPLLVDVVDDTLNMDPNAVEAMLARGEAPSTLLPVHLYGHPSDLGRLREIAGHHDLAVVEDSAHSLPAKFDDRPIGSDGAIAAFSFYATKNMTTAEGGMLVGPKDLIDRARVLSLHGMSTDSWRREGSVRPWEYEIVAPGFKYNMSEVHAAIGLAQLAKLPDFYARRRQIVERYNKAFSDVEHVRVPSEKPDVESACHIYVLRLELEALTICRDRFIEELRSRKISTSVHFKPVHMHAYFQKRHGYGAPEFPVASEAFRRIVSLPLYPAMSDADADDVIEAVADVLAHFRR